MPHPTESRSKRKPGRKPLLPGRTKESLTTAVDPRVKYEVEVWAARAGVSTSELGRWVWAEALAKIKRRGRNWLRRQVEVYREEHQDPAIKESLKQQERYFEWLRQQNELLAKGEIDDIPEYPGWADQ